MHATVAQTRVPRRATFVYRLSPTPIRHRLSSGAAIQGPFRSSKPTFCSRVPRQTLAAIELVSYRANLERAFSLPPTSRLHPREYHFLCLSRLNLQRETYVRARADRSFSSAFQSLLVILADSSTNDPLSCLAATRHSPPKPLGTSISPPPSSRNQLEILSDDGSNLSIPN